MPEGDPVNLYAAIVVAVLGISLGLFLIVRFFIEARAASHIRKELPDFGHYDRDVQRYLARVGVLIGSWRPRLDEQQLVGLEELWQEALSLAERLQQKRNADEEVAADVAEMVKLENRIEGFLDTTRD